MAVTDRTLANVHMFPTAALFTANTSSIANTDVAFVKADGSSGSYDMGNIIDQSLGQNGYIKYANGLMIQWGKSTNTVGIDSHITIQFPTQFSSTVFTVLATDLRSGVKTESGGENLVRSWTTESFYFYHGEDHEANVLWVAIGM